MTTTDPTERVRGAIRAARVGDPAPAINLDTLGPTDSELESPTPLAEQIARAHRIVRCPVHDIPDCSALLNGCTLPARLHANALHIATATERAVRERIAAEIEAFEPEDLALIHMPDWREAMYDAARIARGAADG